MQTFDVLTSFTTACVLYHICRSQVCRDVGDPDMYKGTLRYQFALQDC